MRCLIFLLLAVGCIDAPLTSYAQSKTDDYYSDQSLRYTNHVYQKGIETIILHRTDDVLAYPFIDLAANESLTLHFDDLVSESVRSFNYGLIHCNAKWEPSGLLEMEYLGGFFQGNITNYEQSFNTKQNYIHYQLTFPGETDMQITLPGNYIIFVYENGDKEKPVLTQRFVAYNQTVNIKYEYKRPTDPEHRNYLQEVDVNVFNSGLQLNRNTDLKVAILQNGRWDNAVYLEEPKFIRNNELIYDADEGQQFNGGSEFRALDIRNLNVKSGGVIAMSLDSNIYSAYLFPDARRSSKRYLTSKDANGNFVVMRDNSDEPHTQSDYVWVFFRLGETDEITDGDVFIYGNFCGWALKPELKMQYDDETGDYTAAVRMKQGYYNYEYAVSKDGKNTPDDARLEGTHFDTENDFTIIIYYHDLKTNTDLAVGSVSFNTHGQ